MRMTMMEQPMKTTGPRAICAQCQKPLVRGAEVVDIVTPSRNPLPRNGATSLVETYHARGCIWGWTGAVETGVPNLRVSPPNSRVQRVFRWRVVE